MQQEEKSKQAGDDNDEVPENNDPHFEPIISLPALVEVKTGEEDETVMFSHRANLYRFESSTKEWKEAGEGNIKILYNRGKNTYRILLRRYFLLTFLLKTILICLILLGINFTNWHVIIASLVR